MIVAPVPESPQVFPGSPGKLMANFAEAYGGRDLEAYRDVLHPDFRFQFQPCDVEALGLAKDHFGKREELEVAAKMFSGKPVVKKDGRVLPAIGGIEFLHFEPCGEWTSAADFTDVPGALMCTFEVLVRIKRWTPFFGQFGGQFKVDSRYLIMPPASDCRSPSASCH